jgi:hypothetical protein
MPKSVTVDGCNALPCEIRNGTDFFFDSIFDSGVSSNTLEAFVIARLAGINVGYELPEESRDGCQFIKNGKCPVTKGQEINYSMGVPVDAPKTGVVVSLEFRLIADNKKDLALCFIATARITK